MAVFRVPDLSNGDFHSPFNALHQFFSSLEFSLSLKAHDGVSILPSC